MLLLFKCETCHHEWDDTRRESFCDWCGEYGHILEDKTGKYNFIFKGVKSLLVFLILFGTIGIFLLCCSNSRVTDSFDSVIIDSSAFIITFPTDFDSVLKNKTFACPIIQTVHFTQLDTTLVIVEEDTLKTVFLLYIMERITIVIWVLSMEG